MIYPSLNYDARLYLNDANGKPAPASFSRAGNAGLCNAIGLLATAAAGALRHDYAADGRYLGWLIEEQRSNLALHSAAADNAAWTKINTTITANASVAPDGTLAADKIVEASDVAQSHSLTQAIVFTAATYCLSVYLKAAGRNAAMVQLDSATPSNAFFDLSAGTVGYIGSALASASITACGNGWYRCAVVGATAAATRSVRIAPSSGTAHGSEIYNGDGSSGIHAWGAQVELGSFPSSYIATTGATVTRAGDLFSLATSAFPFNPSEGSLLVHFDVAALGLLSGIARLHNASFGGIALYRGTGNLIALDLNDGTPRGNVAGSQPLAAGEMVRVAAAWQQGDGALCINGGAVATFAPSAIPAGLDTLELGGGNWGTAPLGGHLRHAAYFPRRLGNAELQDLTRL